MQLQIVGIGDSHLRYTSDRNPARLRALDTIRREGLQLPQLAAWVHVGDVFDGQSTATDRNWWKDYVRSLAECAPVIIVRGNHCTVGDLSIYGDLAAKWPIRVANDPSIISVRVPTGHLLHVACLPYQHRASLVAAGATRPDVLDAGMLVLQETCQRLATDLNEAQKTLGEGLGLFAAHINVEGSIASNGQPSIGKELSITTEMLRLFKDVPQLLGHIHLPQDIGTGLYIGSNAADDWGETEQKRFVIVTLNDMPVTMEDVADNIYPYTIESRPLGVPSMWHVDAEFSREAGFTWQVRKGPGGALDTPPATWVGSEVRVRYRIAASERGLLDEAVIHEIFKDAARLDIEPIVVPDRGLRAPEVQAAQTLHEKVGAWGRINNTVTPDGMFAKLAALEQGESGSVLTQVAQQITIIERGTPATVPADEQKAA